MLEEAFVWIGESSIAMKEKLLKIVETEDCLALTRKLFLSIILKKYTY